MIKLYVKIFLSKFWLITPNLFKLTNKSAINTLPGQSIVMCTWKRVDQLEVTLNMLDHQITPVSLYIWNNNKQYQDKIDAIINKFSPKNNLNYIYVYHSPYNIGGFGRFYAARWLRKLQKYIIFLDDDQLIDKYFVKKMLSVANTSTVVSFWAYKIHSNYWDRTRVFSPYDDADYCGTGGMVIDTNAFKAYGLFRCPAQYWFMEDLWLSFYLKYSIMWHLGGVRINVDFVDRENDQGLALVDKKGNFYKYLTDRFS